MKVSLNIIACCILLMLGVIYVVGTTLSEEGADTKGTTLSTDLTPSIPSERQVFAKSKDALLYKEMPEGNRSLSQMKKNRAFPGAPPMIPHKLLSNKGIGDKSCLQCHLNGGFASQFNAYTPITPHPDFINCVQCHLPQKTKNLFKGTDWEKNDFIKFQERALTGAPPMIPHTLQLRDNCLACHAGAAAPKEIRVSHPERVNCKQCHLPIKTQEIFVKPTMDSNSNSKDDNLSYHNKKLDDKQVAQIKDWINKQ